MSHALVFDLDGTLVDTAPDLLGAMNAVLVQEGRRPVDAEDLRHLVGHGARAMLDEAFKRTGEAADAARLSGLIDAFIVHYRAHIADASRPENVMKSLATVFLLFLTCLAVAGTIALIDRTTTSLHLANQSAR